ncbi:MAG: hypothetical protein CO114_00085 [Euryarchaeota archaeon CG_4_9_14_3_um_filter_38_12]|nr:MAG: hypothetical protein CO114_00085 [Euryarchaeota archaeon CG_4_9_14_3_um_filter_38_12]
MNRSITMPMNPNVSNVSDVKSGIVKQKEYPAVEKPIPESLPKTNEPSKTPARISPTTAGCFIFSNKQPRSFANSNASAIPRISISKDV